MPEIIRSLPEKVLFPKKNKVLRHTINIFTALSVITAAEVMTAKPNYLQSLDPNVNHTLLWAPEDQAIAIIDRNRYSVTPSAVTILKSSGEVIPVQIPNKTTIDRISWQNSKLVINEHFMAYQEDTNGYDDFGQHGGMQQTVDLISQPSEQIIDINN